MLICPKCNFDNELGRIFCHQCGAKLDLEQIKAPSRGGKPIKKKGGGSRRSISILLRLLILAGLVVVIVLMFQMPVVKNIPINSNDLSAFYSKRTKLENATYQRKPVAVTISEAELNSFIDNIQFEAPEGRGVKLMPTNIQVDFNGEDVTAYVIGKIKVGEKWEKGLGIVYTGIPAIENGKFVFHPKAARIGKLQIPMFILVNTGLINSYYSQVFGKLESEIELLNKLDSIDLETDNVVLAYKPKAQAQTP